MSRSSIILPSRIHSFKLSREIYTGAIFCKVVVKIAHIEVAILRWNMTSKVKGICCFPLLATEHHVVAKLYDPLYFDDDDLSFNPFKAVNYNYTREVVTYEVLSDLQGSTIPTYYGSYSLDIPVDADNKRRVRLILIELISGSSMQDLDPEEMPQRVR